jgi:hypothetical protein
MKQLFAIKVAASRKRHDAIIDCSFTNHVDEAMH